MQRIVAPTSSPIYVALTLVLCLLLTGGTSSCSSSRKAAPGDGRAHSENRTSAAEDGAPGRENAGGQLSPAANKEAAGAGLRASGTGTDAFLAGLLARYPQYFGRMLRNLDSFRVQIIYTQIDRDKANRPHFRDYYYRVDTGQYFYPASTVKLPTAILALQQLDQLRLPGLDMNSTMITGKDHSGQTAVYNDPSTPDGRPSIAQYIRKILLVSDNDAFNRLYEFLGQENLNRQLHDMGYTDAAILHRLEVFLSEEENRHTNPITFYDSTGKLLYQQPMQESKMPYPGRHDLIGNAWYGRDGLVQGPMDFSKKNRIGLEDLHHILRAVLFPADVPDSQRFRLRDEDYAFLRQYLSEYPGESVSPQYDSVNYPDAYGKLLYWGGDLQRNKLPSNIRIFSKEGDAYGFLTDISYFADLDHGIEFMLSATIYCNSDGVLNDSQYDYETVGLPFLRDLGRVIYVFEAGRPRKTLPDLSGFRMSYQ